MGLLDGKVALVTGSGRGIGREIALQMAAAGAKILVNDVGASLNGQGSDVGPGQEVVGLIRGAGGAAELNTGSVADADAARAMVAQAVDAFGQLDIVVNNAGILRDVVFHKMTDDDWDAVIKVHLYGSFNVSRAAATHFRERSTGTFVHMTSTSGLIGGHRPSKLYGRKTRHRGAFKADCDRHEAIRCPVELYFTFCMEPDGRVDPGRSGTAGATEGAAILDAGQDRRCGRVASERRSQGNQRSDFRCSQE